MELGRPESGTTAGEQLRVLLQGFSESAAALCLCDDVDLIRYANPTFCAAFFPHFDGCPTDFMTTIVEASRADRGLRIVSASPDEFAAASRRRRAALVGSHSFSADLTDGRWWSVTETKLSSGWMLVVAQDISSLKNEEARLRDAHDTALAEAQTDFLTGIPNRRYGLRRAEQLWKKSLQASKPCAVALFDIDHFKAINDIYGHDVGDRALVHFAKFMMASMAREDAFSRLGGDEFLMVRPRSGGATLRNSLLTTVKGLPLMELPGSPERLRLSVSVGIAETGNHGTWAGLMHRADMALYDAKAGGRNRIEIDNPHQSVG